MSQEVERLTGRSAPVERSAVDGPGPLHVAGRCGLDLSDDAGLAEAPQPIDAAVVGQVDGDGIRPGGGQDVDHTTRHVRGLDDLDEGHRGERVLARDHDDRVAHGEGRGDRVDDAEEWQSVRRADSDHADRLVRGRDLHPGLGHGLHGAAVVDGPRSPVEQSVDAAVDFLVRRREFAVGLEHDLLNETQSCQVQLLGHEHQDLASEVATGSGPLLVGTACRRDRVADVLASGQTDLAEEFAGERADLEASRFVRTDEGTTNQETVREIEGRQPTIETANGLVPFFSRYPLGDGLLQGHVVDPLEATLASKAALTRAAEAGSSIELLRAVDPPRSAVDLARDDVGLADVARPDRAGQAVLGVVRERDGLFGGAEGHDRQHWAEDLLARDRVRRRDVEEERRLDEEPGRRQRAVGLPDLGAVFFREPDEPFDLVELRARVHRAEVDTLVERIVNADSTEAPLEHLGEAQCDRLVDDESRTRAAHLPLVEEDAAHHALDSGVEVGVVADDGGGLAPELHRHLLERTGRRLADLATRAGGAREHDFPRGRVADDHAADLAVAGDDVHDTGREANTLEQFGEVHDRHRGGVPGLDHDRVSGADDLGDLPRRHEQGEVPRDHGADDTPGHAVREAVLEDARERRVVAEVARSERNIGQPRFAEGLAVVHGLEHFEVAAVAQDGAFDGVEVARPFAARELAPLQEGALGSGEGRIHVGLGRLGEPRRWPG